MVEVRVLNAASPSSVRQRQQASLDLARRLPRLTIAAREVAASLRHGLHGRRQAGIGESFWQFRPFVAGESASRIDWRRSARDTRTYVREREWEAAHTVWLWMDRSSSMGFVSSLAQDAKADRALVLGLAAADLLVRGGERVGLIGLLPPVATRLVVDRFAEALIADRDAAAELPQPTPLPARAQALLIGDFLSEAAAVAERIDTLASRGARGHLLMIADPAEESFPFAGRTEFLDSDGPARFSVGNPQGLRAAYVERLARHRDAILAACRRRGWTFALHHTDGPASAALLALHMRLEGSAS